MSEATDWIAANLDRIEGGHMTLGDLSSARFMLRDAVKELRSADARIAAAQESLRDRFAMAALNLNAFGGMPDQMAEQVYAVADAMLKARSK